MRKAYPIHQKYPHDIVIAADTVVYFDHCVIGKPHDRQEAYEILMRLSHHRHDVYTGVAIYMGNDLKTFSDGAELAATVFDKSYEVAEITVLENKILISLKERQDRILTPSNWIGEEAI